MPIPSSSYNFPAQSSGDKSDWSLLHTDCSVSSLSTLHLLSSLFNRLLSSTTTTCIPLQVCLRQRLCIDHTRLNNARLLDFGPPPWGLSEAIAASALQSFFSQRKHRSHCHSSPRVAPPKTHLSKARTLLFSFIEGNRHNPRFLLRILARLTKSQSSVEPNISLTVPQMYH